MNGKREVWFVLVHGAGHGGWCWYNIRTLLEAAGHKVTCPDLRCSGIDIADFNAVFEFDDYNEPLTTFMSSLPPNQKVIVVGHSLGGLNITDVINKFAHKIHCAVYIAADMSKHGYTTSPNLKGSDVFEFIYGLGPDQPPTGVIIKPECRRSALYHMSPIQDYTLASMLLRPSPARALVDVRFKEGPGAESVPRVFIRTLNDQLMSQQDQDAMIKQWPPSRVYATESDHSPFFSTPDALFRLLLRVASEFVVKYSNL